MIPKNAGFVLWGIGISFFAIYGLRPTKGAKKISRFLAGFFEPKE